MKTNHIVAAIAIAAISFSKLFAQDGAQIFRTNCGACHTVGKGKLVGPDLKGVQDRHTEEWILKWVKGSQAMVKAGDKDAITVATQKVAEDEKAGPSFITSLGFTNYLVLFLIGILLLVIWVLSLAVKTLTAEMKLKTKN
jgi:cytochrome c2